MEQLEERRLLSTVPDIATLLQMGPSQINPDLTTGGPNLGATQVPGSLAGNVLYTSGGHGFYWTGSSWGVMRSYVNGMMEDMNNQDQLEPYADYALAAGATFVSMRPVGHQVNEVLVDNSDTFSATTGGFQTLSGTWTSNTSSNAYWSDNNGNDAVHYLTATTATTESAVARFTPKISVAGFYPVYAWWDPAAIGSARPADDMLYRVNYSGGSAEVHVAADKTGDGWVYLGNYYFDAGVNPASGSVDISNKSATAGKLAVADGIRFGNGMGDVNYSFTYPNGTSRRPVMVTMPISGQPREDEAALYWAYAERGWTASATRVAPSTVYNGTSVDDMTKNFDACDIYATYMNQGNVGTMTDRLWISFHSNASDGNGVTRGTLGLINSAPTPNQAALALLAGEQVQNEMAALDGTYENPWVVSSNPTFSGGYSEISQNVIGGEFDATIIEVAFHDQAQDATDLKDPKVRMDVGRAALHTAILYFQEFGGLSNVTYAPEPPTDVRATTDTSGNVILNWSAGPSSSGTTGPYGNAATGYRIFTSTNGYGFSLAGTSTSPTFTLAGLSTTAATYFKITAINGGGESLASTVVAAKPTMGAKAPILIVNNFSRVDAAEDQTETYFFGTISRARESYNNSFNYVVQGASSIVAANSGLGFDSCSDSAIAAGEINLGSYSAVIWMSGIQSTVDQTFTSTTEPLVTAYMNGGGKMFVSGSEIAWDLFGQANETSADESFFNNTLHATYVADDAGVYATGAGVAGSALASVGALNFDNGTQGTYDVQFPDVLGASGAGASVAMNYSTGSGHGAVIQYQSGNSKMIYMGFPLESIYTASQRNSLMAAVLTYFGTTALVAPGTPDLVASSDTGTSNSDNLTSRNNSAGKTLQFSVANTISGETVQILSGTTVIGSAVASSSTTTVTTDGVNLLADGAVSISARQTDGTTTSPPSGALAVTVDSVAPTAVLNSPVPQPVGGATTYNVLLIYDDGTGSGMDTSTYDNNDVTVTGPNGYSATGTLVSKLANHMAYSIPAPGGSWDPGDSGVYTVTQVASQVSDIAGNARPAGAIGALNLTAPFVWVSGSVLHVDFAGSSGITMGLNVNGPNMEVTRAAQTLPFDLTTFSSIAVSGTAFGETLTSSGTYPQPVTFTGNGGADALTITSGTYTFASDAGATAAGLQVTVNSEAAAVFNSTQHLGSLNVGGVATLAAGDDKVIVTKALAVSGQLDLKDNALVWDYSGASPLGSWNGSAYDGATGLVAAGRHGGDWSGNGIITSMSSAIGAFSRTTIGVASAADVLSYGGGQTAMFAGETVDATAILFKYTYAGDLDLNGKIDGDDYFVADQNYPQSGSVFGYAKGDIDFNGRIDADDFFQIDANYAGQGLPL